MADTALGPLLASQPTREPTAPARPAGPAQGLFGSVGVPPDMNPGETAKDAHGQASAADTPTTAATGAPTDLAAALPTLDDLVAQRCAELGIDPDFQRQSDWLKLPTWRTARSVLVRTHRTLLLRRKPAHGHLGGRACPAAST